MSEENKGKLEAHGEVKACPKCGVKFASPLTGGIRCSCADPEDGGCGANFVVVYS